MNKKQVFASLLPRGNDSKRERVRRHRENVTGDSSSMDIRTRSGISLQNALRQFSTPGSKVDLMSGSYHVTPKGMVPRATSPRRGAGILIVVKSDDAGRLSGPFLEDFVLRLGAAASGADGGDVLLDLSAVNEVPSVFVELCRSYGYRLRAQQRRLYITYGNPCDGALELRTRGLEKQERVKPPKA